MVMVDDGKPVICHCLRAVDLIKYLHGLSLVQLERIVIHFA